MRSLALLITLGVALRPTTTHACGPCTQADIWDAQWVKGELTVTTNFGILRPLEQRFHLDCEELFGGLLSKIAFDDEMQVASTTEGFVARGSELCEWESVAEGASNTWFLDFALVSAMQNADAGAAGASAEATVFALVLDEETTDLKVERAIIGDDFTTLATFPSDSGLRNLVAGGHPTTVFTTGYTFEPRAWHVEYGDPASIAEWQTRSFQAESELFELRPLQVDPITPGRLWLRAVTDSEPEALWRFDASDAEPVDVFTLDAEEKLADLAFSGSSIYIAGRGLVSSTLYIADASALEFEALTTVNAELTCFNIDGRGWLGCNGDFTRDSPWLVASSEDQGESWQPLLKVADLGDVASCGDRCNITTGWLKGLYGTQGNGGMASDDSNSNSNRDPPSSAANLGGCACRTAGDATNSDFPALLAAFLLACALRRSRNSGNTI